jgi:hypothetical protein
MKGFVVLRSRLTKGMICAFFGVVLIVSAIDAASAQKSPPNPCALAASMRDMHASFIKVSEIVHGANVTVDRIHHTGRSAPYKNVEKAWDYIKEHNDPLLDHLTDLQMALDTAREGRQKQAALNLIAAYQTSLSQMYDYAHYVVADERTENALSKFFTRRNGNGYSPWGQGINQGVVGDVARSNADSAAKDLLTEKMTLFTDALLAVKLPEYRYARFCRTKFPDDIAVIAAAVSQ